MQAGGKPLRGRVLAGLTIAGYGDMGDMFSSRGVGARPGIAIRLAARTKKHSEYAKLTTAASDGCALKPWEWEW